MSVKSRIGNALRAGLPGHAPRLSPPRKQSPRAKLRMPRLTGMDAAASALRYWERKQEVVANNLANVSTDAFKGQRVFARLLDGMQPAAESSTDLATGELRQTGSPLDV